MKKLCFIMTTFFRINRFIRYYPNNYEIIIMILICIRIYHIVNIEPFNSAPFRGFLCELNAINDGKHYVNTHKHHY